MAIVSYIGLEPGGGNLRCYWRKASVGQHFQVSRVELQMIEVDNLPCQWEERAPRGVFVCVYVYVCVCVCVGGGELAHSIH